MDATPQTASTLSSVLHLAPVAEELRTAAESVLADALERHSEDAQLLFDVATLRLFQGENQEAIRLFRRTLEARSPKPVGDEQFGDVARRRAAGLRRALACIDRALAIAGSEPELLDSKPGFCFARGRTRRPNRCCATPSSARVWRSRHYFHLCWLASRRAG